MTDAIIVWPARLSLRLCFPEKDSWFSIKLYSALWMALSQHKSLLYEFGKKFNTLIIISFSNLESFTGPFQWSGKNYPESQFQSKALAHPDLGNIVDDKRCWAGRRLSFQQQRFWQFRECGRNVPKSYYPNIPNGWSSESIPYYAAYNNEPLTDANQYNCILKSLLQSMWLPEWNFSFLLNQMVQAPLHILTEYW